MDQTAALTTAQEASGPEDDDIGAGEGGEMPAGASVGGSSPVANSNGGS